MQKIAELIDQQILDRTGGGDVGALRLDRGPLGIHSHILKGGSLNKFPVAALVPRSAGIELAMLALSRGIIEELVD
jgi:hypothetical protein